MKRARLMIMGAIVTGLLFSMAPLAWGGGGPAGETPCCQVERPGGAAEKLIGTMAIVYDPANNVSLDVMLRLEKKQELGFFRLNLSGSGANLTGKTNEEIACLILNPFEGPNPEIRAKVRSFVAGILSVFFPGATPDDVRLVIKSNSISDMQGYLECEDPAGSDGNVNLCLIPGTERFSSIGDIKIFAIDYERFHKVNPACE